MARGSSAKRQARLCAALQAALDGGTPRPPLGDYPLWNAFAALSRRRGVGMAGANPITYAEIDAWCRLTRTPLEPHHLEIILALDAVWLDHAAKGRAVAPEGVKTLPPVSAQGLSPALFDVLM